MKRKDIENAVMLYDPYEGDKCGCDRTLSDKIVTVKTEHPCACGECNVNIFPGQRARRIVFIDEGDLITHYFRVDCIWDYIKDEFNFKTGGANER